MIGILAALVGRRGRWRWSRAGAGAAPSTAIALATLAAQLFGTPAGGASLRHPAVPGHRSHSDDRAIAAAGGGKCHPGAPRRLRRRPGAVAVIAVVFGGQLPGAPGLRLIARTDMRRCSRVRAAAGGGHRADDGRGGAVVDGGRHLRGRRAAGRLRVPPRTRGRPGAVHGLLFSACSSAAAGMSIDFVLARSPATVLGLVAASWWPRPPCCVLLARYCGSRGQRPLFALLISQGGEFSSSSSAWPVPQVCCRARPRRCWCSSALSMVATPLLLGDCLVAPRAGLVRDSARRRDHAAGQPW
ncbi:hypothetical protein ACTMU2_35090 [Cupriavidus basilensis]